MSFDSVGLFGWSLGFFEGFTSTFGALGLCRRISQGGSALFAFRSMYFAFYRDALVLQVCLDMLDARASSDHGLRTATADLIARLRTFSQ